MINHTIKIHKKISARATKTHAERIMYKLGKFINSRVKTFARVKEITHFQFPNTTTSRSLLV